jgi:hypothetical protein
MDFRSIKPWYASITGGHIYPAVVDGVRHFASIVPRPKAKAFCGVAIGKEPGTDVVERTCGKCSSDATALKV